MRRKFLLGVGLAALAGSTALGQFAADRVPPTGTPKEAPQATQPPQSPVLPKSPQPAAPVVGGFEPVTPSRPVSPPSTPGYTPLYSSPQPPRGSSYVPPPDGLRPPSSPAPLYGSPTPAAVPVANLTPRPQNVEMPTAIPKTHPWLLKEEHGPWFILVKSYVRPSRDSKTVTSGEDRGPSALDLAEGLAKEIRDTFRVQAFLYEYISDERKEEFRAMIEARHKAETEYIAQLKVLEEKAKLQGIDFLKPDMKFRVMRHAERDQIGVLVGGFQSETDASKALVKLKTWPAPKNEQLMDGGVIVKAGADGKPIVENARLNPYATAFVVANPVATRAGQPNAKQPLDPFVVKLNQGLPNNLLKATKNWTLIVKSFSAPMELVNKDSDTSLMKKLGIGKGADVLAAGAEQAEAMAKALREMKGEKGESLNFEAFVFHTRTSSFVTVGQFDRLDDPELIETRKRLSKLTLVASEDQAGKRLLPNAPTLFETIVPMAIPKVQPQR